MNRIENEIRKAKQLDNIFIDFCKDNNLNPHIDETNHGLCNVEETQWDIMQSIDKIKSDAKNRKITRDRNLDFENDYAEEKRLEKLNETIDAFVKVYVSITEIKGEVK